MSTVRKQINWKRTLEILGISLGGMWAGFLISDLSLYGRIAAAGAPQDAGAFLRTLLMLPIFAVWAVTYILVRRKLRKIGK